MNLSHSRSRRNVAGLTLVETMVGVVVGTLLIAVVVVLAIYSSRAFSAMSNYVDLDMHSRNALDLISREVRGADRVVDRQTNAGVSYITLTNTPASNYITVGWVPASGTLWLEKKDRARQVILTGCDDWNVWLYNRAPNISRTNLSFNAATNLAACKLINMTWKCSRTILGSKLNTESVQTAQIVLRNKVK